MSSRTKYLNLFVEMWGYPGRLPLFLMAIGTIDAGLYLNVEIEINEERYGERNESDTNYGDRYSQHGISSLLLHIFSSSIRLVLRDEIGILSEIE